MPKEIPRVVLVDTFAKEVTDTLAVASYFGKRRFAIRIDTCQNSVGEGGTEDLDSGPQKGLTVDLVKRVRMALLAMGADCGIFLSGGLGNPAKAEAFGDANRSFRKESGLDLFEGAGIGEIVPCISATADVFEVDGAPFAKTGREWEPSYSGMEKII
jgi:nicotinic acid phosphoribosyltransferase